MKKSVRYEHKVVNEVDFNTGIARDPDRRREVMMLEALDKMSADGWEVINASVKESGDFRVLLRREVET